MNTVNGIKSIYEGMLTVLKHLFKKAVTLEYPEKRKELNDAFRGKHILSKSCVGCGLCQRVCPSDAISIKKDSEGRLVSYKIDYKKCIFCGNCEFYCPKNAIKLGKEYELAQQDKTDLMQELCKEEND